ncbi:peptide-methionine (R)-S-oxide reductase [Achromobacter deleyi]|uniref:peptide-methionine (R)-S-oxide reductase MsrB n=1 Tax=Achromobacter deleyi TaxID=1353891 RepID=UPI002863B7F2|nr:peptide-methionine (R)-S-oxide reductase MsrB [Achromobacter deleyi]MDR6599325.1 peptide-methionine (R)-S-oxide reductase [Achromobacter deleyi]
MTLNRRHFLSLGGVAALAASLAPMLAARGAAPAASFPYALTDAQWRARLTPVQFDVLRREGTERPYTSPLNDEHRKGTFSCAGCEQRLFSSNTKFDSGTGWPSFWQPLDAAVGETRDRSFGMVRTAVHCANCGGHLGHVFDDGPRPTGLRYCMNGVAMTFAPQA